MICPGMRLIRTRFYDGVGWISTDIVVHGNLTAAGCIKQILIQHVLVAAYGVGPEFVLMHDM